MRNVLGVNVVHQVFQRDGHGLSAVRPDTVVVVVDGDKPHSHEGQYLFQKVSGFQEVAPKPGHILDDNAVDFSLTHLFQKLPDGGPFHVRPRITVITKFKNLRPGKFRPQLNETVDVGTLIDNAVAFAFFIGQIAVLGGEPDVNGNHIVQHLR